MDDGETPTKEKVVLSSDDDSDVDAIEELEKELREYVSPYAKQLEADLAFERQRHESLSAVPNDADNADDDSDDSDEELEKELREYVSPYTKQLEADLAFERQRHESLSAVPNDADNADDDSDDSDEELEKELREYVSPYTKQLEADLAFERQRHESLSVVPNDADNSDDDSDDDAIEELEKELLEYRCPYAKQLEADLAFERQRHESLSAVPNDADNSDDDSNDDAIKEMEKKLLEFGCSYTKQLDADLAFERQRQLGRYADDIIDYVGKQLGDDGGITTQVGDMGCVIGGIKFVDRHRNVTDCTQLTVAKLPLVVDGISVTNFSAMFILLVEKIDLATRLRKSPFYFQFPCVIVAIGRKPDYSTRKFLYMLNKGKGLNLQLFALLDCNPHSVKTVLDLIHNDQLDINWLGIQPCHVPELIKARVLAGHMIHEKCNKNECLDLLELSLLRPDHRPFRGQVRLMLGKVPYKVPVEALLYDYLIDCYLPRKLRTYSLRVPVTK